MSWASAMCVQPLLLKSYANEGPWSTSDVLACWIRMCKPQLQWQLLRGGGEGMPTLSQLRVGAGVQPSQRARDAWGLWSRVSWLWAPVSGSWQMGWWNAIEDKQQMLARDTHPYVWSISDTVKRSSEQQWCAAKSKWLISWEIEVILKHSSSSHNFESEWSSRLETVEHTSMREKKWQLSTEEEVQFT